MALSDMKVFNQYVREATVETVAQMVDKFNAASAGAIQLSTTGFDGDYMMRSSFASLHAAQRRVDRYATNTSASSTALAQLQHNSVKIAGGFGPIVWEPAQLRWVGDNPAAAVDPTQWWTALSQQFTQLATSAMKDTATDAAKNLAGTLVKQSFDAASDTLRRAASVPGAVVGGVAKGLAGAAPQPAAKSVSKPAAKAASKTTAKPRPTAARRKT